MNILNTFVKMRRFLAENALMFDKLNSLELKQLEYQKESNEKFDQIFAYISEHEEVGQKIFFEGQIYDALDVYKRQERYTLLPKAAHSPESCRQCRQKQNLMATT